MIGTPKILRKKRKKDENLIRLKLHGKSFLGVIWPKVYLTKWFWGDSMLSFDATVQYVRDFCHFLVIFFFSPFSQLVPQRAGVLANLIPFFDPFKVLLSKF